MPRNPAATRATQRVLHASPTQVFAAFRQPALLAQWWGPAGSTNTFGQFDFVPSGRWVFVMHGPDGKNHHTENIFRALEPRAATEPLAAKARARFIFLTRIKPLGATSVCPTGH